MDDNDFEVEAPTPLLPAEQQANDTPLLEWQPEGAQPRTPRKRFIQVGLVVMAFVMAIVLVGVPLATRPGIFSIPQPPPPPRMVLLRANINFGTVTVNGKRQRGTLPMFVPVRSSAQGDSVYQIAVDAPPFSQVTCTVSFIKGRAAASGNSGCTLDPAGGFPLVTANGTTASPDFVVDLSFTAQDLPIEQQKQINGMLLQSFTFQQTMSVPAGSYIATRFNSDDTITSQHTSQALQATAFLSLSTDLSIIPFACQGFICQGGIMPGPLPTTSKVWLIESPAALRWQFTTASGRVVGDVAFPAADLTSAMLVYDEHAGWSLAPSSLSELYVNPLAPGQVECQTGSRLLFRILQDGAVGASGAESQKFTGCKISLQDLAGASRGVFIWRFGVLLAVDKVAHQTLPSAPIAPQAEIDAVPA